MAVRIRLRRMGRKKQPHYRIVVADNDSPRDGRFVENLGYYRPLSEPARLVLDLERVDYWLSEGASPSGTVKNLIDRARKGGDAKVAVGEEESGGRKPGVSAGAEPADATRVPEDEAEHPEGSSAQDATAAEAMAEGEEEAVARTEAEEPNEPAEPSVAEAEASAEAKKPAASSQDEGAKAGGEVAGTEEVQAPAIETPEPEEREEE